MTTDRRQQRTNGRLYVEGTLVETHEEGSRRRRRRRRPGMALLPVIMAAVIGALIARRVLRGAAA